MRKLILATAVAFLTSTVSPTYAMQSRNTGSANNALATCVLSLIVIGLPLGCKGAKLKNASAKKAQVTIHKPEGGKCANGNEYRIMRHASVAETRHVCKNSFRGGKARPACANLSIIRGSAYGIIHLPRGNDTWKAHEIKHVCNPAWNHF